jgi:5-deoxy-D-glucuronate isomerase
MTLAELKNLVRYVTTAGGEQTEVVIPIAIWTQVLQSLALLESGLHPEDEDEPKEKILADLQAAIRAAKRGETFPVSELWDKVYE